MSAVSRKLIPESSAASTTRFVASTSKRPPKLLQPRPTKETSREPIRRISMLSPLRRNRTRSHPLRIAEIPPAPERPVELDQRRQPIVARLGEEDLGGEELLLGLEDVQVARQAGHVALVGDLHR